MAETDTFGTTADRFTTRRPIRSMPPSLVSFKFLKGLCAYANVRLSIPRPVDRGGTGFEAGWAKKSAALRAALFGFFETQTKLKQTDVGQWVRPL